MLVERAPSARPAPLLPDTATGVEVILAAPGQVRVAPQASLPGRPSAGSVTVEVDCVTLCGSDLALFRGDYAGPSSYPIRCGHEWSGRVVATSAGSRLRLGTRVTGDCSRWCGDCELCQGDRNLCRKIEKFGITTDGFAVRRRNVPERYLYADRHGLPADVLALCEIFAVALRGAGRALASAAAAREALVVGGGALGIAIALILRHHLELPAVWVLERDPGKIALLRRRFSRLRWLEDPGEPEREGTTYADLHRLARFPVVFECSGSASGLGSALLLAGMGATVVDLGLGPCRGFDSRLVVTKGLSLLGSIGGTGAFPAAMDFLARHRDVAARLVTHRFAAGEAAEAFRCGAEEPGRLKVQLRFG